jgi:hypothetical protein
MRSHSLPSLPWVSAFLFLFALVSFAPAREIPLENAGFESGAVEPWTAAVSHEADGREVSQTHGVSRVGRYGSYGYLAATRARVNLPAPGPARSLAHVEAVVYQTVTLPEPESGEFTFAAWTKSALEPGTGLVKQSQRWTRVGIDLSGGTDPDAPTVVWSGYDTTSVGLVRQQVTAPTQTTDCLTVFMQGSATIEVEHRTLPVDQWVSATVVFDDARLSSHLELPPHVHVTAPVDREPLVGAFPIAFTVSDDSPTDLVRCEILVDGDVDETIEPCPQGDHLAGPYDLPAGEHTFEIRAVDWWDNTTSSGPLTVDVVPQQPYAAYDDPAGGNDVPIGIGSDGQGYLYVVGTAAGETDEPNVLVLKYDSRLRLLWDRSTCGAAADMTVDADGNVYVTGFAGAGDTASDLLTLKYDTAGNLRWYRTYSMHDPETGMVSDDLGVAVAIDAEGGVVVTGYSRTIEPDLDDCVLVALKYDADGMLLWVRHYESPEGMYAYPAAIALDGVGDVIVAARSADEPPGRGAQRYEYLLLKYGPDGSDRWVRTYIGPQAKSVAHDVAVGGDGIVYVTGSSLPIYGDYDYLTLSYGSGGDLRWEKRYNGIGNGLDSATAVAVGPSGSIYVAGISYVGMYTGQEEFCIVKYAADGTRLWVRRHGAASDCQDFPKGMWLDAEENVYVTGSASGGVFRPWSVYSTVAYDQSGNQLLARTYSGLTATGCVGIGVVADADGNAYVTGRDWKVGESHSSTDIVTLKYPARGALLYGKAELGSFVGDPGGVPCSVAIREVEAEVECLETDLSPLGNYWVFTETEGQCDVLAKPSHWLAVKHPDVELTGVLRMDWLFPLNGDARPDNVVDLRDFQAVLTAWSLPDPMADLDGSGWAGVEDLLMVLANFGLTGDQ